MKNGDTLPALVTDRERWRYMIIERGNRAMITTMADSNARYKVKTDTKNNTLLFTNDSTSTYLNYEFQGEDALLIRGKFYRNNIYVLLKKKDTKEFLLMNRGFPWVNEYPFNR